LISIAEKCILGADHLTKNPSASSQTQKSFPLSSDAESILVVASQIEHFAYAMAQWIKTRRKQPRSLILISREAFSVDHPAIQELATYPHVSFAICPDPIQIDERCYAAAITRSPAKKLEAIQFVNLAEADSQTEELYRKLIGLHRSLMSKIQRDSESAASDFRNNSQLYLNILSNLKEFLIRPDLRQLHRQYPDRSAVVLGAGPSLNDHLSWIQENRSKTLLIATDTLYSRLKEASIEPDIFTSVEQVEAVADLYRTEPQHAFDQSIGVFSAAVHPKVLATFRGDYFLHFPVTYLNSQFPFKRMAIGSGHSSAGLGIRLASFFGCPQIFLVGIDLAWSQDGSSHSNLSPYEKEEWESFQKFIKDERDERGFSIESNTPNQSVTSSIYWTVFKMQFEKIIENSGSRYFNLSQNGAKIKGAPFIKESEAAKLCQDLSPSQSFRSRLNEKIYFERHKESLKELSLFIDQLATQIEMLSNDSSRADFKDQSFIKLILGESQADEVSKDDWSLFSKKIQAEMEELKELQSRAASGNQKLF